MGPNPLFCRSKKFILSKTRVSSFFFFFVVGGGGGSRSRTNPPHERALFIPITRHGCYMESDLCHSNNKTWDAGHIRGSLVLSKYKTWMPWWINIVYSSDLCHSNYKTWDAGHIRGSLVLSKYKTWMPWWINMVYYNTIHEMQAIFAGALFIPNIRHGCHDKKKPRSFQYALFCCDPSQRRQEIASRRRVSHAATYKEPFSRRRCTGNRQNRWTILYLGPGVGVCSSQSVLIIVVWCWCFHTIWLHSYVRSYCSTILLKKCSCAIERCSASSTPRLASSISLNRVLYMP